MSDIAVVPSGKGMQWWTLLTAEQKTQVVRPHIQAGLSNKDIQKLLGLDSASSVAYQRHKINHEDPSYVGRSTKTGSPKQKAHQGPSGLQIVNNTYERRRSKGLPPELERFVASSVAPLPPSYAGKTRDEIIDAEVARSPLEAAALLNPDSKLNQKDTLYGAWMNAVFTKLIDAGVAL